MRSLFLYDFKVTYLDSNKRYSKRILSSLWGLIPTLHKLGMWFLFKSYILEYFVLIVMCKPKHMSNLNMSIPKSNFEGHLILMCLAAVCFWHVRKVKGGFCTSINLLRKYILNYFGWVELRILVGKWNIYEAHIFTTSLGQKCCLETTTLCLSTPLRVKKIHYQYFYLNFGKTLTFMCSTPNI